MVKESNLGGGHCEPRKATKDRWASNVGGGGTAAAWGPVL